MFLTRFILLPSNPPALSKSSSLVEGEKEGGREKRKKGKEEKREIEGEGEEEKK